VRKEAEEKYRYRVLEGIHVKLSQVWKHRRGVFKNLAPLSPAPTERKAPRAPASRRTLRRHQGLQRLISMGGGGELEIADLGFKL
jgi:hypothetical protein